MFFRKWKEEKDQGVTWYDVRFPKDSKSKEPKSFDNVLEAIRDCDLKLIGLWFYGDQKAYPKDFILQFVVMGSTKQREKFEELYFKKDMFNLFKNEEEEP